MEGESEVKQETTQNGLPHVDMLTLVSSAESVQGRRYSMEDTHVSFDDLRQAFPDVKIDSRMSLYGVYDGHGGKETADVCEALLHKNLIEDPLFTEGKYEEAITNAFIKTDKTILERADAGMLLEVKGAEVKKEKWKSGSTAVVVLATADAIYVGNTGDSEAVLGKKTEQGYEAVLLSEKHKPSNPQEKKRIEEAGGRVIFGRVLGALAVARALGDIDFKYPYNKSEGDFVVAQPFVNKVPITPDSDFLVIACDGLWDKLTYQEAVDFVVEAKSAGKSVGDTVELLVKKSLDKGSSDNVTSILVYFQHNQQQSSEQKSSTDTTSPQGDSASADEPQN